MIKEYFGYMKLFRLNQPIKSRFGFSFLMLFGILIMMQIIEKEGVIIGFSTFILISFWVNSIFIQSNYNSLSLVKLYPISSKKKVLYHFINVILSLVLAYLVIMALALIILLFVFIFGHFETSSGDETGYNSTLFLISYIISIGSFILYLGHNNEKFWKIKYLLGMLGYLLIAFGATYLFRGNFNIIGIDEYIRENHLHNPFHYLISGLLLGSSLLYYYLAVKSIKPIKEELK